MATTFDIATQRLRRRLTHPRIHRLAMLAACIFAARMLGDWIGYGTAALICAAVYILILRPDDVA